MDSQLSSPPDQAPASLEDITSSQRIALWMDVMDACEQFLLAGLRREIGPDGDLKAAYRNWYAARMVDHDRAVFRLLEELNRRGGCHAR